ncbi:MAG TPA: hypothetical protein GX513_04980 [Firmicutes bacterium]|nr:hypothetical protein [Bacillota bacterium]
MAAVDMERVIQILRVLPEDKVRAAAYFLEFLAAADQETQATLDLLQDDELLGAVRRAERDSEGRPPGGVHSLAGGETWCMKS